MNNNFVNSIEPSASIIWWNIYLEKQNELDFYTSSDIRQPTTKLNVFLRIKFTSNMVIVNSNKNLKIIEFENQMPMWQTSCWFLFIELQVSQQPLKCRVILFQECYNRIQSSQIQIQIQILSHLPNWSRISLHSILVIFHIVFFHQWKNECVINQLIYMYMAGHMLYNVIERRDSRWCKNDCIPNQNHQCKELKLSSKVD